MQLFCWDEGPYEIKLSALILHAAIEISLRMYCLGRINVMAADFKFIGNYLSIDVAKEALFEFPEHKISV